MSDLPSPAALLGVLQPWSEVAEPIHKRLARLVDVDPTHEVLWIGAGSGRSVLWWATRFNTRIIGLDPDADAADRADRAARVAGLPASFQSAPTTDLPFESQVFDVVVVDVLSLLGTDATVVLNEAGRVARPMATVVAIVPSWAGEPNSEDEGAVTRLGIDPRLIVEWKAAFRDAGAVELTVEDAASDGGWMAYGWFGVLLRGWRGSRWKGMRLVLSREFRVLRALAAQRVLGLSIIKGTRWPHE